MKKILKELLPYLIILVAVLLFRTFIATPVLVSGTSMNPTLTSNEVLILRKTKKFKRFDIVVVSYNGDKLIKRLIGMPNDTVEVKDHELYVNDILTKDAYAVGITNNFEKITLKEGEYFVMGDNREVSKDSRYFGSVDKKQMLGTASFVIWPFTKFGTVK